MDGQKQRQALTAAERAVAAVGKGDPESARRAAARAAELDQIEAFAALPAAVQQAAAELESGAGVSATSWEAIAAAVGPGPVAGLVEQLRAR